MKHKHEREITHQTIEVINIHFGRPRLDADKQCRIGHKNRRVTIEISSITLEGINVNINIQTVRGVCIQSDVFIAAFKLTGKQAVVCVVRLTAIVQASTSVSGPNRVPGSD